VKPAWLVGVAGLGLSPAIAGDLTVSVTGVRNDRGRVVVAVCDKATFPKGACAFHGQASARPGEVSIRVAGVPSGTWAAAAYHDEIGNRQLEFTPFGFPKQAVGFSRNAEMEFGPPRFADAAFTLLDAGGVVSAPLRYPP
jgi:uncharacterized protein (DUF2141 family)